MPPKRSAASDSVVAMRRAQASLACVAFVAGCFEAARVLATECIDELLAEMNRRHLWAWIAGCSDDHLAESTQCFQHIQYCLRLEGALAPIAAVALDALWVREGTDNLTHEESFEAAGLAEPFKHCIRAIQDAIANSMIRDPLKPLMFVAILAQVGRVNSGSGRPSAVVPDVVEESEAIRRVPLQGHFVRRPRH
jgi:hypothetical protein